MVKLFSEFRKEMQEDVAVNSSGGGAIAGLGSGANGEPGVSPKKSRPKTLRRNNSVVTEDQEDGALTLTIPVLIRAFEIVREVIKSDDDLHVFVSKLMDLNVNGPLTMTDVYKVFSQYKD